MHQFTAIFAVSFSSLVLASSPPVQHQAGLDPRELITPVAALLPRATGSTGISDYNYGDCDASFSQWMSCAGDGMDSDLCGLNLFSTAQGDGVDSSCACVQATSLYNCYTSYCTTGTEYKAYYVGVSACASAGYGKPPPSPTGAAATLVADSGSGNNGGDGGDSGQPNAGSLAGGEVALWTLWGGLGLGTFVLMLL